MQENEPKPPSNDGRTISLTFNLDGTIDPEQLVGLPTEVIERVTSPEFQREAAVRIIAHRRRELSIHLFKKRALEVKIGAHAEHEARRPTGISGRQRKRLRRMARKVARGNL